MYTSYLQVLGPLHEPSAQSLKRVYPPPPVSSTSMAGFMAGAIQSTLAAPIDALQLRFHTSDVLDGKYANMWRRKLAEIGFRGVFAGWKLSFLKDSMGYAAFFATFEYVKAQSYYAFVTSYYGSLSPSSGKRLQAHSGYQGVSLIKPHYTIEPAFLMAAGVSATITQQIIQHPLTLVQAIHYNSLSRLAHRSAPHHARLLALRTSFNAYMSTYKMCLVCVRLYGAGESGSIGGLFSTPLNKSRVLAPVSFRGSA